MAMRRRSLTERHSGMARSDQLGSWGSARRQSHGAAMMGAMIDMVAGLRTGSDQPLPYKIVRQAVRESLGVSASW